MKIPYLPQSLPISLDWTQFITLIGSANAELARYDGILQSIINPRVLLSPLTTNEAVLSSKIEGTQASLHEVLAYEASPKVHTEKYNDIQEIINYRKALDHAIKYLDKKPITLNLVKEIHGILLNSVRGRDKARGEFRSIQNFIGRLGSKIEDAIFIPPAPLGMMEHLFNFEKYIHYDEKDRLVQLAFIHAQFELIHPFLDGNGRVGRILIPLFLFEKQVLKYPMFYISEYLEKNRDEYYSCLNAISEDNNWNNWIKFFLTAIIEQSKTNSIKAKAILALYEIKKERITEVTHSQYGIKILDAIFTKPIFNTSEFINISQIPRPTAKRVLIKLKEKGILSSIIKASGRRAEVLAFDKLLKIIG